VASRAEGKKNCEREAPRDSLASRTHIGTASHHLEAFPYAVLASRSYPRILFCFSFHCCSRKSPGLSCRLDVCYFMRAAIVFLCCRSILARRNLSSIFGLFVHRYELITFKKIKKIIDVFSILFYCCIKFQV
jgi:hypothetical protein